MRRLSHCLRSHKPLFLRKPKRRYALSKPINPETGRRFHLHRNFPRNKQGGINPGQFRKRISRPGEISSGQDVAREMEFFRQLKASSWDFMARHPATRRRICMAIAWSDYLENLSEMEVTSYAPAHGEFHLHAMRLFHSQKCRRGRPGKRFRAGTLAHLEPDFRKPWYQPRHPRLRSPGQPLQPS